MKAASGVGVRNEREGMEDELGFGSLLLCRRHHALVMTVQHEFKCFEVHFVNSILEHCRRVDGSARIQNGVKFVHFVNSILEHCRCVDGSARIQNGVRIVDLRTQIWSTVGV